MIPSITHGAFSWSELMTPDPAGAAAFYGKILGWTSQNMPMPQGDYHVQMRGQAPVAGIMSLPHEPMPTVWAYYVTVNDVDETLKLAESLGANIVVPAMDVPTVGRFASFTDPHGAYINIISYEPMAEGAEQNAPEFSASFVSAGAFSWFELQTPDVEAASDFYRQVFGWDIVATPMASGPYNTIKVDGDGVGGLTSIMMEGGVPSYWSAYITVDDADAVIAAASDAGGKLVFGPTDIPTVGRTAMIQDPTGGMVSVIKYGPFEQPA